MAIQIIVRHLNDIMIPSGRVSIADKQPLFDLTKEGLEKLRRHWDTKYNTDAADALYPLLCDRLSEHAGLQGHKLANVILRAIGKHKP